MTPDEIARLRESADHMSQTSLPWEVHEVAYEEDKPNLASRIIRTVCMHPQLKAPEEIVTMMHCHPKYTPQNRVYIRPEHAAYIVAACNALPRLLDEYTEKCRQLDEAKLIMYQWAIGHKLSLLGNEISEEETAAYKAARDFLNRIGGVSHE